MSSSNYDKEIKGSVSEGKFERYNGRNVLTAKLRIYDKNIQKKLTNKEITDISMGGYTQVVRVDGVWQNKPYDHIQKGIIFNHVALVEQGRGGSTVSVILNKAKGDFSMKENENFKEMYENMKEKYDDMKNQYDEMKNEFDEMKKNMKKNRKNMEDSGEDKMKENRKNMDDSDDKDKENKKNMDEEETKNAVEKAVAKAAERIQKLEEVRRVLRNNNIEHDDYDKDIDGLMGKFLIKNGYSENEIETFNSVQLYAHFKVQEKENRKRQNEGTKFVVSSTNSDNRFDNSSIDFNSDFNPWES